MYGNDFLCTTPKAWAKKEKINLDFSKIKNFCFIKDIIREWREKPESERKSL